MKIPVQFIMIYSRCGTLIKYRCNKFLTRLNLPRCVLYKSGSEKDIKPMKKRIPFP